MSTKLFVGNLSFKTREPDLAKFFETIGSVKTTNIIARGPRSLGYGFVEFERAEDASTAEHELNKKELDGRPINVEFAKPRDPAAPRPQRPRQRQFYRGPRPARSGAAPDAQPTAQASAAAPATQQQQQPQRRQQRRPARPRGPRANGAQGAAPQTQAQAPAPAQFNGRPFRRTRRPRAAPAPGAEPSKTTLFVANLPFIVDDEGLLEVFEGMNVKEAHVVTRPNGRSKGYGFVTFDNEEDCSKALEAVDKSIVEGRDITVRPAMAPFRKTEAAPAPAQAAPAVASPAESKPAQESASPAESKPAAQ